MNVDWAWTPEIKWKEIQKRTLRITRQLVELRAENLLMDESNWDFRQQDMIEALKKLLEEIRLTQKAFSRFSDL
jgi:hypothetical protein